MTDDRIEGEVVFFNGNSFGFIRPDGGSEDAFFHISELPVDQAVQCGDRVTYKVEPDPKKPNRHRAVNVRVHS